jgi:ribosomal protein S18 acetylase RimI-like enzyme
MTAGPAGVEIRDAATKDYAAAGRVAVAAYAEFLRQGDSDWAEYLEILADVRGRAARTVVLVAIRDNNVVGTVTIELEATIGDELLDLPPETASLRMLAVEPAVRGRGIGRALVEAAVERCHAARKKWLILNTAQEQRIATRLYRSLGFQRDPVRDHEDHTAYKLDLTEVHEADRAT